MRIRFEGRSDDLACWTAANGAGDEHDDCGKGTLRAFRVEDPDGGALLVFLQYAPAPASDCWMVGYAPDTEGAGIPAGWSLTPGADGYTAQLDLEVPDGTTVTRVLPKVEG